MPKLGYPRIIPPPQAPAVRGLVAAFDQWRTQNHRGGLALRWRRRPVWLAQLRQRLGQHVEVSAPLFFGERMRVVTGENSSKCLLTFGYNEVALSALLLHLLRPGDIMVDIGTHLGYEAILAAHMVGESGRVVCFEPHPATRAVAARNLAKFPQVEIHAEALAASAGTMRLANNPVEKSAFNSLVTEPSEVDTIEVPVSTLDLALPPLPAPVTIIKCDAEGFELPILKGGRRVLERDAPVVVLEAEMPSASGASSERAYELASHLEPVGYTAYNFDYDGALKIAPLGGLSVHHANVLFLPQRRAALHARLGLTLEGVRASSGRGEIRH